MAKLIINESKLVMDHEKTRRKKQPWLITGCLILVTITVLFVAGFIIDRHSGTWALPISISIFAGAICIIVGSSIGGEKFQSDASGIQGEEQTRKILQRLPDSYTVISNVTLGLNQRGNEIDHLVLGDNGVFIVETKNYAGTLTGYIRDREWTKTKTTGGGNKYEKEAQNPIPQIKKQTMNLKEILSEYGIRKRIESIVYFSNPDARFEVDGYDPNVQIFVEDEHGAEEMLRYIQASTSARLSEKEKQDIIEILRERQNM